MQSFLLAVIDALFKGTEHVQISHLLTNLNSFKAPLAIRINQKRPNNKNINDLCLGFTALLEGKK